MNTEDRYLLEKAKREVEENRLENSFTQSESFYSNLDDYYKKKVSYFETILKNNSDLKLKYPKLDYKSNPKIDKYIFNKNLTDFDEFDLKNDQLTTIDDLLKKLDTLSIEECFHQQFDFTGQSDFYNKAFSFIEKNLINFSKISELKENEEENTQDQKIFLENNILKALRALITVNILFGKYTISIKTINFLLKMKNQFGELFSDMFQIVIPNLKNSISLMIKLYSEANTYPIIKNYSINDIISISKQMLFSPGSNKRESISITTDNKFIYLLIIGLNGGMMKIGTGVDGTEKGKIYLHSLINSSLKKNFDEKKTQQDEEQKITLNKRDQPKKEILINSKMESKSIVKEKESTGLTESDLATWTFFDKKLYLKNSRENCFLSVYDPETFDLIEKVKIKFPEESQHVSLKTLNSKFVLTSNGKNLQIIMLESVQNELKGLSEFLKESNKNLNKELNKTIDQLEELKQIYQDRFTEERLEDLMEHIKSKSPEKADHYLKRFHDERDEICYTMEEKEKLIESIKEKTVASMAEIRKNNKERLEKLKKESKTIK